MARKFATFILLIAWLMTLVAGMQLLPAMKPEWSAVLLLGPMIVVIAIHEAGHAMVARMLGARVLVIAVLNVGYDFARRRFGLQKPDGDRELAGFVRYTLPEKGARIDARAWIAASGPLANMVTALVAISVRAGNVDATLSGVLAIFLVLSFGMAAANLVPFPGSDGEQILNVIRRRRGT